MAPSAEELQKNNPSVEGVAFKDDPAGPSTKVVLSLPGGDDAVEIYLFGAHTWRWRSHGEERLWQSTLSVNDGSAPMRGGIPIAFPQFADQGELKLHGFARNCEWTVVSTSATDSDVRITLQLEDTEETRALWPHKFKLRYTVALSISQLFLELEVLNSDTEAWDFTTCLHTYFRVLDIEKVRLEGLQGCSYVDKVDGYTTKTEEHPAIVVPAAAEESKGFVDRIYSGAPKTTVLHDEGCGIKYIITQTEAHTNTVVFNPWIEGKKGDKGPDYDDDGYKYAICVEPTIARPACQELQPGGSWAGSQLIKIESLASS